MKGYYDIAGDGGSNILEQVQANQERIDRNLSGVRTVLAVGSGKGGVGKSTLTMQLACALRERGREVAILDADLNGPSQARLGGVADRVLVPSEGGTSVPKTLDGIGVVSMGSLFPETTAVSFESVATGSSQTWRATKEFTVLRELLASMNWGPLDVLLVDLPPGAERIVQYAELLGADAKLLLVTIPSDLARGVVSRSVAALEETPNRVLGYVQNMSGYYCSDCEQVKPLFPTGGKVDLDLPCLGNVPFDPRLADLCDRGGGLAEAPALPSWASIRKIAEQVDQAAALRQLETE